MAKTRSMKYKAKCVETTCTCGNRGVLESKYSKDSPHNTKESAVYSLLPSGRCSNCASKTKFQSRYDNQAKGNSVAQLCQDQEWDKGYNPEEDNNVIPFTTFSDDVKRHNIYDSYCTIEELRNRRTLRKLQQHNANINKYLSLSRYNSNQNFNNKSTNGKKTKLVFSSYCSLEDLEKLGIKAEVVSSNSYCSVTNLDSSVMDKKRAIKRSTSNESYCSGIDSIADKKIYPIKKRNISVDSYCSQADSEVPQTNIVASNKNQVKNKKASIKNRQNSYCSDDSLFNDIPLNQSYISQLSTESEPINNKYPILGSRSIDEISKVLAERSRDFSKHSQSFCPDEASIRSSLRNSTYGHTNSMPVFANSDVSISERCVSKSNRFCTPIKKPTSRGLASLKSKSRNSGRTNASNVIGSRSSVTGSKSRISANNKPSSSKSKINAASKSTTSATNANTSEDNLITRTKRAASRSLSNICRKCFPCFRMTDTSAKSITNLDASGSKSSTGKRNRECNPCKKYKCSCSSKSKSATTNSRRTESISPARNSRCKKYGRKSQSTKKVNDKNSSKKRKSR